MAPIQVDQQAQFAARVAVAVTRIGRLLLLGSALMVAGFGRIALPTLWYLPALAGSLVVLYLATRGSSFRWWAAYLGGFGAFVALRATADETLMPWLYDYAIAFDQLGGLFGTPTVWIQGQLYRPGQAGLLDWITLATYLSYFIVGHLIAALIWAKDRQRFPRYVIAMVGTYFIGLAGSFLLPTAPPWLAAQKGHLPQVYRVVVDLTDQTSNNISEIGDSLAGSNVVAAMPSLHTAVTVVIAIVLCSRGWRWGVLGITYAAAMSFSLVYLGEHYLVDVIAGALTGAAAWRLAISLERHIARPGATDDLPQSNESAPNETASRAA